MDDIKVLLEDIRQVRRGAHSAMMAGICDALERRLFLEMNNPETHAGPKWDRKTYMREYMRRYRKREANPFD